MRRESSSHRRLDDMIAVGIMDALFGRNIRYLPDISVMGCDNTLISSLQGGVPDDAGTFRGAQRPGRLRHCGQKDRLPEYV